MQGQPRAGGYALDSESMLFAELIAPSVEEIPMYIYIKSKRKHLIFFYLEGKKTPSLDKGGINSAILFAVC